MQKIILFGDSLFNGFKNFRNTRAITDGLKKRLSKSVEIVNMSKSGATTDEALSYIDQIDATADVIVIEYGTNDSSVWGISCNKYAKNLETIINYFDPRKIIVVGPWHSNSHSLQARLFDLQIVKQNIETAKILAEKYHCPFIDFSQLTDGIRDIDTLYQNDGLHLSNLGNERLLDLIIPAIEAKLISKNNL